MKRQTCIIYACGPSTGGIAKPCDGVTGKYIHNIQTGCTDVIALCDDGMFAISDGAQMNSSQFISASEGAGFSVGVAPSGSIYSWGIGPTGELGQGLLRQSIESPLQMKSDIKAVGTASGEFHSLAIDEIGNAFAWGQNFDRQLGLYTKEKVMMRNPNCMVEEIVFLPRFLPFSLENPVKSVSCGAKFSIFVTKQGDVWSCGAGECGQLGTGRCTKREVPTIVPFPQGIQIVDSACGWGHVIVTSVNSEVFAWGLNKHGQLGLGDTLTRHQPVRLPDCSLATVYANGYSSAGISSAGRLFTWGCGNKFRLMQGNNSHISAPTEVTSLGSSNLVSSFAFSPQSSAAMVPTTIFSLYPPSGPQKSFSRLNIYGCGFWDAENIIIKFLCIGGSGFSAPRSCPGRLASPGVLSCRPPRLSEPGEYQVSVSMDGTLFLPTTLSVFVYKDFLAANLSPRLIDMRAEARCRFSFVAKGLTVTPPDLDQVDVKVLVTGATTLEHLTKGYFVQEEDIVIDVPPAAALDMPPPEPASSSSSVATETTAGESQKDIPSRKVQFDLDFEALGINMDGISNIRLQASINGQDFSAAMGESDSSLCHAFQPLGISPDCFPCAVEEDSKSAGKKDVTVEGRSFLGAQLPPRTHVEAIVSAVFPGGIESRITVKCKGLSSTVMEFPPPSISQLFAAAVEEPEMMPSILQAKVQFQFVETPAHTHGTPAVPVRPVLLSERPLSLLLYVPQKVDVLTKLCRRHGGDILTLVGLAPGGLRLKSSVAAVQITQPELGYSTIVNNVKTVEKDYSVEILADLFKEAPPLDSAATAEAEVPDVTEAGVSETVEQMDDMPAPEPSFDVEYKSVFLLPSLVPTTGEAIEVARRAMADLDLNDTVDDASKPKQESILQIVPAEMASADYVMIGLLLDGISPIPSTMFCRLNLFDGLKINADPLPVPKGGAVPGTVMTVAVHGLVQPIPLTEVQGGLEIDEGADPQCTVRLKGTNAPHHVDIVASAQIREGKVTFTVPDAAQLGTLTPEAPKKGTKMLYIGVSIDGNVSFDFSEKAILQIK